MLRMVFGKPLAEVMSKDKDILMIRDKLDEMVDFIYEELWFLRKILEDYELSAIYEGIADHHVEVNNAIVALADKNKEIEELRDKLEKQSTKSSSS